jgi:hypothetical protein
VVLGSASGVTIGGAVTKKALVMPLRATAAAGQPLDLAVHAQNAVPVRTELALRGIHAEAHPGVVFKVFIERSDDPSRREFVGSLSFFEPLEMEAEHHMSSTSTTDRVFDVTRALRSLGSTTMGDLNVVFEAGTGRLGARETPHFNTRSNLTVDRIELRVKLREDGK